MLENSGKLFAGNTPAPRRNIVFTPCKQRSRRDFVIREASSALNATGQLIVQVLDDDKQESWEVPAVEVNEATVGGNLVVCGELNKCPVLQLTIDGQGDADGLHFLLKPPGKEQMTPGTNGESVRVILPPYRNVWYSPTQRYFEIMMMRLSQVWLRLDDEWLFIRRIISRRDLWTPKVSIAQPTESDPVTTAVERCDEKIGDGVVQEDSATDPVGETAGASIADLDEAQPIEPANLADDSQQSTST